MGERQLVQVMVGSKNQLGKDVVQWAMVDLKYIFLS